MAAAATKKARFMANVKPYRAVWLPRILMDAVEVILMVDIFGDGTIEYLQSI